MAAYTSGPRLAGKGPTSTGVGAAEWGAVRCTGGTGLPALANRVLEKLCFRERRRAREASMCCSTYRRFHRLVLVCDLTRAPACSLGVWGRRSNGRAPRPGLQTNSVSAAAVLLAVLFCPSAVPKMNYFFALYRSFYGANLIHFCSIH